MEDSKKARYIHYIGEVYMRIAETLPALSWEVSRTSQTFGGPGNYYPELLSNKLSHWLNNFRLPPLCFWVWLEISKGFPNVAEFLATCPTFMFETALKEALQSIAYVHSSNGDQNCLVDLPSSQCWIHCSLICSRVVLQLPLILRERLLR